MGGRGVCFYCMCFCNIWMFFHENMYNILILYRAPSPSYHIHTQMWTEFQPDPSSS